MQLNQYVVALACRTDCTACANAPSLGSIAIEIERVQFQKGLF
jgi:hypothetical protein